MFCAGLALFTLASAAGGAAGTATQLVIARLIQGVAAALLMPNVLSIIGVQYTGPDRIRALSLYGTVMGLAAVGGQLIGGLMAANVAGLGWRSCFDQRPDWSCGAAAGPQADPRVTRSIGSAP